jgi:thiol-disulfide isomerase/thioredoxin
MILSGCNDTASSAHETRNVELGPFSNTILSDSLQSGDKLTLVNFYATWCRPCVKEIPDLLRLQDQYPDKLRLMMVSIDDEQVIQAKLPEFLIDKKIQQRSWFLPGDNPETAEFILNLYPQWGQSIPLSLLYNQKGILLQSFTGQINPEELRKIIESQKP